MKNFKITFYVFLAFFTMISCNKDDGPELENIPEATTPEVLTPEVAAKVTSATLGSVDGFEGPCSKTFDFEAEVEVDGPLTVKYVWLRSDNTTSPEETIEFDEAGSKTVNTAWTLGGSGGTFEGYWQQLKIISPSEMLSNKAEFDLICDEDTVAITATTSVTGEEDFTGECPKKFDFESEIEASGPTTVTYTWLRSDGGTSPEETVEFEEAGTITVNKSWTLGESGTSYEGYWQQLKIITPNEMLSNKAEFNLHCDEEVVTISATTSVTGEDDFSGECPKKFDFESEIEASGPTIVKYTWLRSDGATSPEVTLIFDEAGTKTVTKSWTLGGSGSSYEGYWQQVKIIAPEEILSNKAKFDLHCDDVNKVELVSANPTSPKTLFIGDKVDFSFEYATGEIDGVRIFGRPMTAGAPTTGYAAHGSSIIPIGEGTGTGFFTINSPAEVDQIRFQMWDADQNNLLYETFVDVDYQFLDRPVEASSSGKFVHKATAGNTSEHITTLDNDLTNGKSDAILIVTQLFDNSGIYNANEIGVWYQGGKWKIFNQNLTPMPNGAAFNVLVLPANSARAFVHTTSNSNIDTPTYDHSSSLNNILTNGKSNALVFVTQSYGKYNTSNVGVWYFGGKWRVYNENTEEKMPVGTKFNVLVLDPGNNNVDGLVLKAFKYTNGSSGYISSIDSPIALDENSTLFTSQNYNGTYNPHNTGVWRNGSSGWTIYNQDFQNINSNARFNVFVAE